MQDNNRIYESHWKKLQQKDASKANSIAIRALQIPSKRQAGTFNFHDFDKSHELADNSMRNKRKRKKKVKSGSDIEKTKSAVSNTLKETSEEALKRFDPIIVDNCVQLTRDKIEVCRMLDKFVPTPTSPLDVFDQELNAHLWAERLR